MKITSTKYKRISPKTQIEYTHRSFEAGGGFYSLLQAMLKAIVKAIKHFGILYMNRYSYVAI